MPPDIRVHRRRLLKALGAGAVAALAACQAPVRQSAPEQAPGPPPRRPATIPAAPPPPPDAAPPMPVIEVSEPRPVVLELELALSWPARPLGALVEVLEGTRWRASIVPTAPESIDQLRGKAATADLISPTAPAALAVSGRLAELPSEAGRVGGVVWHPAALATGNISDQRTTALPLGMWVKLFIYRSDLLEPPTNLFGWRAAAAALARHDERFVRFAGVDLAPAVDDPKWLLFAGPECGPDGCYSRPGSAFFRSLFADPGIAFRRDHPRTDWPPSALAGGTAASGLDDWRRIRQLIRGTPMQGRLATAAPPQGLGTLEGGGKLWLAVPAGADGAGLEALSDLDLRALSAVAAEAGSLLPTDVSTLIDLAGEDPNLLPLLDSKLRLYDWRLALGPVLGALAGVIHRALALGTQPVEETLARFEQAVAQSRT